MGMLRALAAVAALAGRGEEVVAGPAGDTWLIVSPGAYLESKIREGMAKGVDPAVILAAVRERRESFRALGDALDGELREAGKGAVVGDARHSLVLEMQRAIDLGSPRDTVLGILRESVRASGGDRADEELLVASMRFAGAAAGSGISADRVSGLIRLGLSRGYKGEEFRTFYRGILGLRERLGGRYPPRRVGSLMEEGIRRFSNCREAWEHVRSRLAEEVAAGPPPAGPPASRSEPSAAHSGQSQSR